MINQAQSNSALLQRVQCISEPQKVLLVIIEVKKQLGVIEIRGLFIRAF